MVLKQLLIKGRLKEALKILNKPKEVNLQSLIEQMEQSEDEEQPNIDEIPIIEGEDIEI